MSDFYNMVTPPGKRKKRFGKERIVVSILIALVFLFIVGFILVRLAGYNSRVREFRAQLSNSTVYAYDNDCLRAEIDGQAIRVTGDHAYDIYQFMSVRSLGRNALFTPRGEPVTLDYGDGSVLRLWADRNARGVYLRYDGADGSRCLFHSKDMRLNDIIGRYLSLSKNAAWE